MIQLLFLVLFAEAVLAFLLLVKIGPLRDLVIKSLDQLKMGKGPATVKTIAGTMSVILLSSVMSIFKIQNKGAKLGTMSPMDQVLWRTHLLEASLMVSLAWGSGQGCSCGGRDLLFCFNCFTLFLGFIIDRMHHYLRKLINLRGNVGSSKEELERLRKEQVQFEDKEEKASKELKKLKEEISSLSESLKKAKLECEEKDKRVETAEVHVASLQKQAADLLLEYDRLLEDNQNLQAQVLGKA
ncbi:uncharacterized protein LOC114761208 isoform X1 [Neltuma alba]|uniref:uncharacterized protein LOC114761208 isoform X1 n=1 Tax=Neltuma alba TaxID=207710 RepID=UPI0010A4B5BC|nr:uncharacterized protein LOC114761208 isoform X1 [Prosopis alba]XP_028806372.1 uncharacterized protein LOC114761208 isoform X1 [Prosopis alba]